MGSGDAVADEGEAFVAHFEAFTAFVGGEIDEVGQTGMDGSKGRLDLGQVLGTIDVESYPFGKFWGKSG